MFLFTVCDVFLQPPLVVTDFLKLLIFFSFKYRYTAVCFICMIMATR